jgi:hypothetical protein
LGEFVGHLWTPSDAVRAGWSEILTGLRRNGVRSLQTKGESAWGRKSVMRREDSRRNQGAGGGKLEGKLVKRCGEGTSLALRNCAYMSCLASRRVVP